MSLTSRLEGWGKRAARAAVGAVSPRLLRRIQLARARRLFLREPTRGPRRLLLEPTTACNHRCEMCWDHSPRLPKATPAWYMPFAQVQALLQEMAEMGTEEVWLAGRGEPLVHPQASEILQLMPSLGMRSIITTNGARLSEELADRLCEGGVQQLSVSIDSGRPETYSRVHHGPPEDRARILGLVRRLSQRSVGRPRLLISMVLSKLNCRELPALVQDAIAAGADGIVVGGMRPVPFSSADLALADEDWAQVRYDLAAAQEMAREAGLELRTDNLQQADMPRLQSWPYDEMACFIGHLFTVVDVHGNVHGCCTCQNKLGSLEDASFHEIWRSRPYRAFRQVLRQMPSTGLTAPQCECRHGCGHVPENAALQNELSFQFPRRPGKSRFATRMDAAQALCHHLGGSLPALQRQFEYADLSHAPAREAASRLRQAGIMAGIGSMDGVSLFEPQRLVARGEFEEILRRSLAACGIEQARAQALTSQARPGQGHAAEPLPRRDMERWLARLAGKLNARQDTQPG